MGPPPLATLRERVWYALQCLPLDERGHELSWTRLAKEFGFPKSAIGKILRGDTKSLRGRTPGRLAACLRVTIDWLLEGHGTPPKLRGRYRPLNTIKIPADDEGEEEGSGSVDDPRSAAIEFARACGIDQRAIEAVRAMPSRAYTPREWLARIELEAAELREQDPRTPPRKVATVPPASPLPPTTRSES